MEEKSEWTRPILILFFGFVVMMGGLHIYRKHQNKTASQRELAAKKPDTGKAEEKSGDSSTKMDLSFSLRPELDKSGHSEAQGAHEDAHHTIHEAAQEGGH